MTNQAAQHQLAVSTTSGAIAEVGAQPLMAARVSLCGLNPSGRAGRVLTGQRQQHRLAIPGVLR